MKIEFDDKSYLECYLSADNKVSITIAAKDYLNPLKKIINNVEITLDQFNKIVEDVKKE